MKLLVTGASGFIGKKLSQKILEKYYNTNNEFIFIVRNGNIRFLEKYHNKSNIKIVRGDITDAKSIEKYFTNVDCIFHLAAKVDYGSYDVDSYYRTNLDGTDNIFRIALENKIAKVVYVSTAAIYHPHNEEHISKNSDLRGVKHVTHYSKSKFQAFSLIDKYKNKGLNIITILPSSVFGYNAPLFDTFIKDCLKYRIALIPQKKGKISIILVDDLVDIILLCYEHNMLNEIFFVSDYDISLSYFVKKIEFLLSKKIFLIKLPNILMRLIFWKISIFTKIFKYNNYYNYEFFKFINGNFLVKGCKFDKYFNWKYSNFDKYFEENINKYIKNCKC